MPKLYSRSGGNTFTTEINVGQIPPSSFVAETYDIGGGFNAGEPVVVTGLMTADSLDRVFPVAYEISAAGVLKVMWCNRHDATIDPGAIFIGITAL